VTIGGTGAQQVSKRATRLHHGHGNLRGCDVSVLASSPRSALTKGSDRGDHQVKRKRPMPPHAREGALPIRR
jgi:hypothetical protein